MVSTDKTAETLGEAAAAAAWHRHDFRIVTKPATYAQAVADLAKRSNGNPIARAAFDKALTVYALRSTAIFTPRLPKKGKAK